MLRLFSNFNYFKVFRVTIYLTFLLLLSASKLLAVEEAKGDIWAYSDERKAFMDLPQVQEIIKYESELSQKTLNSYGFKTFDEWLLSGLDISPFYKNAYEDSSRIYHKLKNIELPKNLKNPDIVQDFEIDFLLTLSGNKEITDFFFKNPKWYENLTSDFQRKLFSDLNDAIPTIQTMIRQNEKNWWLPIHVQYRVYGVIFFLLGKNDEGQQIMKELLSMANGTSEIKCDEFDQYMASQAWVWLNDMLLGSMDISYEDAEWYEKNLDRVDPALERAFNERIKDGSSICFLIPLPFEGNGSKSVECGNSCGGAGVARDLNANDGAALQSVDGASLGACGCSTNAPASISDSASTQTSSRSCCQ